MRVLLCAFSCHPARGSEPFSGWSVAEGVQAEGHAVEVITAWAIEESLIQSTGVVVHRIPVPNLPGFLHRFNYSVWHRRAFHLARKLHRSEPFDVVHHVTYGTVQAACPLANLSARFVFGPAGGGQTAPRQFWRDFGLMLPLELLRSVRVRLSPYRPSVRSMFRRSHTVLASNVASKDVAIRAGAKRVTLMPDSCTPPAMLMLEPLPFTRRESGLVLWNGGMRRIKGIALALEGFAAVANKDAHLALAGDGPMRRDAERIASELRLGDRISFLGRLDWVEMVDLYRRSCTVVVTGFRDSLGAQFVEAGAAGTPCICLDLHGASDVIPNAAAVKVRAHRRRDIPGLLGDAITGLLEDEDQWQRSSTAIRAFAQTQSVAARAAEFDRIYRAI